MSVTVEITERKRLISDFTLLDDTSGKVEIHRHVLTTDAGVPVLQYGIGGLSAANLRGIADYLDSIGAAS